MTDPRRAQVDFGGLFTRPPQTTLAIMIATLVVSVISMASAGRYGAGDVARNLVFSPAHLVAGLRLWTPFTYLFVSLDPSSLLWHELALWFFAAPLERQWGARRFLWYFFGTGAGAALLTLLLSFLAPSLGAATFQGSYVVDEAVVLGFVLMNWHATVFLFILPVRAPFLLVPALAIPALYIVQGMWELFTPVLLGMGIGWLMLAGATSPRRLYLKFRAWLIEQQLKRRARHLRVVKPDEPGGKKGPDGYLH